jgi:hypothetical protein
MNRTLFYGLAFIFITTMSMLNNYLYEWTAENNIAAFFGAINDSPFQRLKNIIYPWFLFLFLFDSYNAPSSIFGLVVCCILIPALYYLALAFGHTSMFFDVFTLFFSIGVGLSMWNFVSYHIVWVRVRRPIDAIVIIVVVGGIITWFTYCTYDHCNGEFYN